MSFSSQTLDGLSLFCEISAPSIGPQLKLKQTNNIKQNATKRYKELTATTSTQIAPWPKPC